MCVESSGEPDAWKLARPVRGWGRGETPRPTPHGEFPANRRPRLEPRDCWPRGSPCSKPWALVRGSPGAMLSIEVRFHEGRKHLAIVTVRRAA
jgi:hypothetical protein